MIVIATTVRVGDSIVMQSSASDSATDESTFTHLDEPLEYIDAFGETGLSAQLRGHPVSLFVDQVREGVQICTSCRKSAPT